MKLYRLSTWILGRKRYVCGRPARIGYTRHQVSAGLYPLKVAQEIAGRLRRAKTSVKREAA